MNKIGDIVDREVDSTHEKHVVIGIRPGRCLTFTDTMPLRRWIEENRIVNYNGEFLTIAALLDREIEYILKRSSAK